MNKGETRWHLPPSLQRLLLISCSLFSCFLWPCLLLSSCLGFFWSLLFFASHPLVFSSLLLFSSPLVVFPSLLAMGVMSFACFSLFQWMSFVCFSFIWLAYATFGSIKIWLSYAVFNSLGGVGLRPSPAWNILSFAICGLPKVVFRVGLQQQATSKQEAI